MTETATFSRSEFDQVLTEHLRLIELANELEYRLHALAGGTTEENLRTLQEAAGTLVSALRNHLFRQDQVVLPLLEARCSTSSNQG